MYRASKWLVLAACAALLVSMTACGGDSDTPGNGEQDTRVEDVTGGDGSVSEPDTTPEPDGQQVADGDNLGDVAELDVDEMSDTLADGEGPVDVVEDVQPDIPEDIQPDIPEDIQPDIDQSLHGLVLEGPEPGSTVSGSILVRLRPDDIEEWPGTHVTVRIDGSPIFSDGKLPTEFVLDTTFYEDGEHTLLATVQLGEQSQDSELVLTFDNPDYAFDQVALDAYTYTNGAAVQIDVYLGEGQTGLTVGADFSALDSGFAAENVAVTDNEDGSYLITYPISGANTVPDGDYRVPIFVEDEDGVAGLTYRNLDVKLRNAPPTPIDVEAAIFVDEPLPVSAMDGVRKPLVNGIDGNRYIITGGSAQMAASISDPQGMEDVIGLIVAVNGYSGYFHKPLPNGGGTIPLNLRLDPNAGIAGGSQLTLLVGAVDRTGLVSEYQQRTLTTIEVMSGDVQVSVSWDVLSDVDLHVVEPSGEELYYGHRNSATGGMLDLDSNAACSGDGVNNENISWPTGQSPPGIYNVLVDYWSNCGGLTTEYTVTIKVCGEVSVFNGTFHPDEADGGGAGSGVPITSFDNTCGFLAEGYVRYEDRTFNREGFRGRTWNPLRYATVEARRNSDGETLGSTTTDRFGYYRLRFRNNGPAGYYVVVKTKTDNSDGLRDVTVYNHPKFSRIYEFLSALTYEQVGVAARIDLDIPIESESGETMAGACNIFDVALSGYDRIRRMTGKELGPLRLFWQTGADTTETLYCSSDLFNQAICSPEDSLQIQGKDGDRDEYDDCVILRQLYKFAESKISATDNPGGEHDGTRTDPRKAWSEGFATFFSCQTRRSPIFVDTNYGGVYRVMDLESEASPFSYGTSSSSQQGYLSEHLVSSILWDMADGTTLEGGDDDVVASPNGVYDAAFNYLGTDMYVGQRAFPGRDFVDFLDGWFCRGHAQDEAMQSLLDGRDFPYDFAGPEQALCQ